jgi:hypothetical protein
MQMRPTSTIPDQQQNKTKTKKTKNIKIAHSPRNFFYRNLIFKQYPATRVSILFFRVMISVMK